MTIVGHCDTSEPDAAKLSLARAAAVLNEVLKANVPAKVSFTVVGVGTEDPNQKTGPNTSEPRNRYNSVTIE